MFDKKFESKLYPSPTEVAADMPERWMETLINNAQRLFDRLIAKAPDAGTFNKVIAEPSSREYEDVLNPARRSKKGHTVQESKALRTSKLLEVYDYWVQRLTRVFGNGAQLFKEAVTNAKSWWAQQMAKVLRFTGDRVRGRRLAPIAAAYLAGDQRARQWAGPGDTADGNPYDITRDGETSAFKAAFEGRLVQGGTLIIASDNQAGIILAQNEINMNSLNGFRDTAKADAFVLTPAADKCFCLWRVDDEGQLYLHTQVGIT
ncbi:MAG: hypothetical protein HY762_04375, partial [Planctomycetes bacterium]|nr:hypothetical protein [Planctomycetota bacterium]